MAPLPFSSGPHHLGADQGHISSIIFPLPLFSPLPSTHQQTQVSPFLKKKISQITAPFSYSYHFSSELNFEKVSFCWLSLLLPLLPLRPSDLRPAPSSFFRNSFDWWCQWHLFWWTVWTFPSPHPPHPLNCTWHCPSLYPPGAHFSLGFHNSLWFCFYLSALLLVSLCLTIKYWTPPGSRCRPSFPLLYIHSLGDPIHHNGFNFHLYAGATWVWGYSQILLLRLHLILEVTVLLDIFT